VDPDDPTASPGGARLHVATVRFLAKKLGSVSLRGTVVTMADNSLQGAPIGAPGPRDIVAGAVSFSVVPKLQRRALPVGEGVATPPTVAEGGGRSLVVASATSIPDHPAVAGMLASSRLRQRRAAVGCKRHVGGDTTKACEACVLPRERGDANGDCFFDIRDVSFTQTFLVHRNFGFTHSIGPELNRTLLAEQRAAMDADASGVISSADTFFLTRVNFGLLRFVTGIAVTPVQDGQSGGLLSINVSLVGGGGVQDPKDATVVLYDLEHLDPATAPLFTASKLHRGELVLADKGPSLNGIIVKAQRLGPLYANGQSLVEPARCALAKDTGNVCFDPQTLRFYFDRLSRSCVSFEFRGCGGNLNNFVTEHECLLECVPTFAHTVQMETDLVRENIGLSLIIVTFDSQGNLRSGRNVFLTGDTGGTATFPKMDITLEVSSGVGKPVHAVQVLATDGYTPLTSFTNALASKDAVNDFFPVIDGTTDLSNVLRRNVGELTVPGTILMNLTASDRDPLQTARIVFGVEGLELEEGTLLYNISGVFSLHTGTGRVTLLRSVDYDAVGPGAARDFAFVVTASDESPPEKKASQPATPPLAHNRTTSLTLESGLRVADR